ncbi:uncharacterized protein LOC132748179 [Ruditapes philippinarum]|uniref:uncharacterized protein LOC132748179 n=1 Tax=Ruditapes philippinarum TaxID=129788 RepID=UPI00295C199B|nr:uncharacterized protein LOC132748179 [Ruditapes philippinarum]
MGTSFRKIVSRICLICVLFVIFTIGQDDVEEAKTKVQRRRKIEKTNRRPDGTKCSCPACMTGNKCSESVKSREPKFTNRFTFVEVNAEHFNYGVPLRYNHTTYPGDDECPCSVFEYSIIDVEDVMTPDNPDRFNIFEIDSNTGKIRLAQKILSSDLYRLTIQVKNLDINLSDNTTITVAREKPVHDELYSFERENGNGYPEEHRIHKRSVIPDEMNFTLTQNDPSIINMRVGTRISFTLDILFPGGDTDISVELFTPDSTTTVMILCDVAVQSIGFNLATAWNDNVVYDSKAGFETYQPDMATLNFGTVTNSQVNVTDVEASTITITYSAVMIDNPLTQNSEYWVSAGAEYLNENYIWVGSASVTAINDGDQTVSKVPTFNVNMPTNVALGSSHLVLVEMFIPYPYRQYVFKAFTPADTVGVMSVCDIRFEGLGDNFGCGNDENQITPSTVEDPQAAGNAIGVLDIGHLLNKASRDDPLVIVDADNKASLTMILHMYPDMSKIGQLLSVGLALEIDDTTSIWIGSSNFTVDPPVTTADDLTDIQFNSVSSSLNSNLDDATVGVPFSMTYELEVPPPTTPSVATQYILEILAPFDGTAPIFSVCSFEVISVGQDMPCLVKEDLVTEYSSRVTGDTPLDADRAKIDLGYVINLETAPAADRMITVKAILKPLASNNANAVNSKHNVSLTVTSGGSTVQLVDSEITIANPATVTSVSNTTAPSFTMSFYDGADTVSVTGSTKVVVDMVTARNITYDKMDMEFLMPVGTFGEDSYTYFHVCRVDISFNGKNMPCMTPEWYAGMIEYYSQYDNYEMDRAKLNIGGMCNHQFVDDALEDKTSFDIYLKVLDRDDLTHMTSKMVSTGLQYSSQNLWVGQLRLNVSRGTANDNVTPTKSTYSIATRNTSVPIPLGFAVSYSMLVKIARGDRAHIRVRASAQQEIAHICTVRVISAGSNLPCVADEVFKKTYTNWPSGSGRQIVELDMGIVNNFGSSAENMTANNYFDEDSMVIETLVRANPSLPAGTATVTIEIYYNTDMTMKSTYSMTDFISTESTAGVSTTVTDAVEVAASVGEITGNLDNTTDIAIGEVKRVLITAVIPEGSSYDLGFSFSITSAFTNKLEICDAAIVSVGDNLPCVDVLTEATITSSGGVFNDSAMFDLGFLCSRVLRPGDRKANTIVFEAYVRLLDNGQAAIGETVTVTTAMRTFLNTVTIDTVDFTVTDPTGFVDRVFDSVIDSVTNETLISLDKISPLLMNIAENVTIKANITVPKLSVSKFLLDVDLPVEDSACLTISEIRIIGSVGRNVLCVPPDVNSKGIMYTPNYNATKGNGQKNYVYVDIGIVTNTGLTHRRKTFMPGDDDLVVEFDIQMADCASSDNGKIYKLSIGNKLATVIFIYDFDIQVVRDGTEKPDIDFIVGVGAASTSTEIILQGIVYHNESSTAEGKNTSFFLSLPVYQQLAPSDLTITSNQTCSGVSYSDNTPLLHINCDNFFFTDVLTFEARVLVNSSVILPTGFSASDSGAQGWAITQYVSRYTTYDAEDWFPYVISGEIEVTYSVEAGIAMNDMIAFGLSNSAIVTDCQFLSTIGNSGTASNARLNNAGAWSPIARENKFAQNRYLVVYLGTEHKFSMMAIQQNEGHTDTVTEVTLEYTFDALSWFGIEVVSLGVSPSDLENKTLTGRIARGVRISITDDTSNGVFADVGVKFEFYGQKLTSDVTQQEACDTLTASQKQSPSGYPAFKTRSFVEDPLTGNAFVCDRKLGSKTDDTECKSSVDGTTWSRMDKRVACMIGFEHATTRLYAYAQNRRTIIMSEGAGPWRSVQYDIYATDLAKTTWTNALGVPEIISLELDRTTPHSMYRIITWGATKYGMYKNNVQKLTWADSV